MFSFRTSDARCPPFSVFTYSTPNEWWAKVLPNGKKIRATLVLKYMTMSLKRKVWQHCISLLLEIYINNRPFAVVFELQCTIFSVQRERHVWLSGSPLHHKKIEWNYWTYVGWTELRVLRELSDAQNLGMNLEITNLFIIRNNLRVVWPCIFLMK